MTEQNQSDDEIDLPGEDEVFDALGMEVMTLARLRAMALPEVQLASIRIVAEDLEPLVRFYEALTGAAAQWLTDDFVDRRIRR